MADLPEYKFDYVEDLEGLIVSMFRRDPVFVALVKVLAQEAQGAENVVWACIAERRVATAVGAQLDQYALLVGEPRGGLTDGDLRRFIQARILSNLSNGEAWRLTKVLRVLTESARVLYLPVYPAGMAFNFQPDALVSSLSRVRIKRQMEAIAGAGIAVYYITEAPVGAFGFLDDDDAQGFDEGGLAEVI